MASGARVSKKRWISVARVAISLLCTLFFCRRYFSEGVSESIDSGWVWALNRAIHDGKVFGREFVFTYGPLGFLSTRYTEYIGSWPLLAGDVLLATGFCYFVFRRLSSFWPGIIVMLAATVMLRNAYYAQSLFLLFFIYVSQIYLTGKQDRLNLVFAALYAVMLFFVKVSYAVLVPVSLSFAVILLIARRDWASLLWLVVPVSIFSVAILTVFRVDVFAYIYNGMSLITGYEEAMFLPVDVGSVSYNIMVAFVVVAAVAALSYVLVRARAKQLSAGMFFYLGFFCFAVFLLYKNGVTRFDAQHIEQFMATFPFLFLSAAIVAGEGRRRVLMATSALMVVASFSSFVRSGSSLPQIAETAWSFMSVHGYYSTVLDPSKQLYPAHLQLAEDKRLSIGGSSVDVIPHEIYVVSANGLNYNGRPVCQSYSVYEPGLDSINADFFSSPKRPDRLLISGNVVDVGRYRGFYEPRTHASIHLNYEFEMTTLPGDSIPLNRNDYFLVFKNRHDTRKPEFTFLSGANCRLGDRVVVPETDKPVYMTSEIHYTALGTVNKLLLQPMPVWITLYMEDGQYYEFQLPTPVVQAPVPISRLMTSNRELWCFLSGREHEARKIKAFKISTHNREILQEMRVAFYSFANYRPVADSARTQSVAPGPPSISPGSDSPLP